MSRGNPNDNRTKLREKRRGKSDSAGRGGQRPRAASTKFYGVQACRAIFRERRNEIQRVFVEGELEEAFRELLDWSERRGIPHKIVKSEELSRIAATEHHEGVCVEAKPLQTLPVPTLLSRLGSAQKSCVLVLEGVENPHNIGAILRTACFFGVSGVVLVSQRPGSLSGAACRVAEGAAESLPIAWVRDAEEVFTALRKRGYVVMATTPHRARSLYSVKWPAKIVVVFGAEGSGLSQATLECADERVVIPRVGSIESLNVGAAVASVLTALTQR